jgi:hypothetical protein
MGQRVRNEEAEEGIKKRGIRKEGKQGMRKKSGARNAEKKSKKGGRKED